MTRKIYLSVMTVSALAVVAAMLFLTLLMHEIYLDNSLREMRQQGEIIASGMNLSGGQFLRMTNMGSLRVTWIASNGRVIFDNESDPSKMDNHSDREEVIQALDGGSGSALRYSKTILHTTLNYAQRLNDGSIIRVSGESPSISMMLTKMLQPLTVIILVLILCSLLMASLMSKHIVKPINNIDLDRPDVKSCYKELEPLLGRLREQNLRVYRQMEELSQNREQFSLITESMKEGLLVIDPKNVILASNSSAYTLLGAEKSEHQSVFALNHSERFRRCVQNAMGGRFDEFVLETDGGQRKIIASPAIVAGRVNGVVMFIMDVTEQQELENMRREFTSNVSHELKTPLTTIYGMADLLAGGIVKQEDVAGFGENIRREADRLITLINDIVSLSKLDEDSIPRDDEEIDIYQLAQEIISRLKMNADAAGVTGSLTGEHVTVKANRTVLDEVLFNLCDNAVKYNKAGGRYEVKVSHIPTRALITVTDTGTGIPAGHIDRIFERFYRVDKSRSRRIKGTGLGLSIVKHGVNYLGGSIRVESEPGKGTAFIVELPVK
ncbi:MAG: PAS domain S-box protein [Ruminococcus sp.]|nr:PAS domain S-box protein [Ruminococcus sp.]